MIAISALYALTLAGLIIITQASRRALTSLWFLLFGSNSGSHTLYAILYLPGTILHEISHFLFAAFLGVRTGDITIFPRADEEKERIQLGSVQIAKTDFIRSSLIGAAPFISGTIFLIFLFDSMGFLRINSISSGLNLLSSYQQIDYFWLKIYGLLAISNTLFTSRQDRRHWPVLIVIMILISLLLYLTGITLPFGSQAKQAVASVLTSSAIAFTLAIVVNSFLFLLFKSTVWVVEWITHSKVRFS